MGRLKPILPFGIKKTKAMGLNIFIALLMAVTLNIPPHLYAQEAQRYGYKYFKNYSPADYVAQPQNWRIIQDQRGFIYAANNGGILQYDGVSWRKIPFPYSQVRTLTVDERGVLYAGGQNDFGFLAPDETGNLKYVSLLKHLDRLAGKKIKNISTIRWAHSTKEGVYFASTKRLFRWDTQELKVWQPTHSILGLYCCNGELYVYLENSGLAKMKNESLEIIPGGDAFAKITKIFMIAPLDRKKKSEKILIGTRPNGFFLYDNGVIASLESDATEYLNNNRVSFGAPLKNGDLAMATYRGGLVILDSRLHLKHIFNSSYGLQDDDVKHLFEDNQGNLWLAFNNGISKIEYSSPISFYDERSGVKGMALSVRRHRGKIHLGTTSGLFIMEDGGKFRQVPGMINNCWDLLSKGDLLIVADSSGVVFKTGKKNIFQRVFNKSASYALLDSQVTPNRIWVGTRNGLTALVLDPAKQTCQWDKRYTTKTGSAIRTIVENKDGSLWLGSASKGVFFIDFPGGGKNTNESVEPILKSYGPSQGLPKGEINIYTAAGHTIFASSRHGIFRFQKSTDKFVSDLTLGKEFAGGDKAKGVFRIGEDKKRNIWFHSHSRNIRATPHPDGSYTLNRKPFLRLPYIQVNNIYPDPSGNTVWFASVDGLIRFDSTAKKDYGQKSRTWFRKINVNGKSIFGGYTVSKKDGSRDGGMKKENPERQIFNYKDSKRIRFEFATPFFEGENRTNYRYFLEGRDREWSSWSKEKVKEFNSLDEGIYNFRVQGENVYSVSAQEAAFQFKILSPFYRTWWAYGFYILLFFLVMYLMVKWRSGKLERERARLDGIVKERTKEVQDKNRILENQTVQLKEQSEKLKEMDRVKSRFFANISHEFRTPLTLIVGPLEQMLNRDREPEEANHLNGMLRNSQRLLHLINRLLDLSRFDSGKIELNAVGQDIISFLKRLLVTFEALAVRKNLELRFEPAEESIFLYFDPPKMEEIIYNLLINAVKFTPAGGQVVLSAKQVPDRDEQYPEGFLELSVKDTGVGIPSEQLPYIFDRFYKSNDSGNHNQKGTGIGLALTKELVDLHQGRLDVHSTEGKGTEFVIWLPMGTAHLQPGEIVGMSEVNWDRKKTEELEILCPSPENESKEVESTENDREEALDVAIDEPVSAEKNVILVVEDNGEMRRYIVTALQSSYTVHEAIDGSEGIRLAKEVVPDLIISDVMMPNVDGYELCNVLKKEVKTSHIPIILLTAKASEASVVEGFETGADDYITKPFNTKILFTRIKNLIDLRRQLQEKIQRQMLLQPEEISVSSVDREFIKEMQGVIEKNLSDPEFNVEELSKKLYMSRATVYRKVMALTGESPTAFIRSYRLKRGAQLLRDNFGNVSQVSLEVGFSSFAYFAKCFKEKFHQLPSTYQASESK